MKVLVCLLTLFVFSFKVTAQNPVPLIDQPLVPSAVQPGAPAFTLTVNGTGFVASSVVNWDGSTRTTHFVSSSQVTAQILASDAAVAGTATITVISPAPGGGPSNPEYIEVTRSKSAPSFSGSIALFGHGGGAVATGDFNGDGKIDLAVLDSFPPNSLTILLGKGDGTFALPAVIQPPQVPVALAVGDFNGDGKLDIAMSENPGNQIEVVLGNGDGTFQPARSFAAGTGPGAGIITADLNGDGKLDLAVADQDDGMISVLLGNGDGTFQSPINTSGFSSPGDLVAGDFNGDGRVDVALVYQSAVVILLGNGDGTFTVGSTLSTSPFPLFVATGDLNGDGKLDLAVNDAPVSFTQRGIRVFLGNGDGTFQVGVEYVSGTEYAQLIVADMNGDGHPDLIAAVRNGQSHPGTAALLLGNGDGTFQSARYYPASSSENAVAAGDFFSDGNMDLAMSGNPRDGQNLAILLQTSAIFLPGALQFQTTAVGNATAMRSSTLTNVGNGPLHITGRAVKGTNPGDFTESDNCPTSLAQGAKCTISLAFAPTADGARSAAVSIAVTGTPKLPAITLKGTGTFAGLTPGSLNFGSQSVGSTSAPQTVTLTNLSATETFKNIATGVFGSDHLDFGFITNTCGRTLAPGASCTLGVVFTPQVTGSRTAHIKVQLSGTPNPIPVTLTGTGTP